MKPKRVIPLIAMILVFLLGTTVRAEYIYGGLRYTGWDGSITITAYYGNEETVTVPAMIDGLPVNYIAAGVFSENDSVKTIILPDCIMGVEAGAFSPEQTVAYSAGSGGKPLDEITVYSEPVNEESASGAAPSSQSGQTPGKSDETTALVDTDVTKGTGEIADLGEEFILDNESISVTNATEDMSIENGTETVFPAGTPAETEAPQTASAGTEDEGSSAVPETALTPAGSPEDNAGQEAEEQKADRAFGAWQYLLLAAGAVALAEFIAAAARKKKR